MHIWLYVHTYIYICVCVCISVYIYIYNVERVCWWPEERGQTQQAGRGPPSNPRLRPPAPQVPCTPTQESTHRHIIIWITSPHFSGLEWLSHPPNHCVVWGRKVMHESWGWEWSSLRPLRVLSRVPSLNLRLHPPAPQVPCTPTQELAKDHSHWTCFHEWKRSTHAWRDLTLVGPLWERFHDNRKCSSDTCPDSYFTKLY